MNQCCKSILAALLMSVSLLAQAQYIRTAVNSSNNPWKLSSASSCLMFSAPSCGFSNNCILEPGQTASIISCDDSHMTLVLVDANKKVNSYIYSTVNRPYIKHEGRTGSVVLNEPMNGDLIFQGDLW